MAHSPECFRARNTQYKRRHDWERKYPDHCTKCGGAGVRSHASLGSDVTIMAGLAVKVVGVICNGCLLSRKCPRCAWRLRATETGDSVFCTHCAWRPGTDSLPSLPSCICGAGE